MADRQVIDSEALNQCVTKYKEALERMKDLGSALVAYAQYLLDQAKELLETSRSDMATSLEQAKLALDMAMAAKQTAADIAEQAKGTPYEAQAKLLAENAAALVEEARRNYMNLQDKLQKNGIVSVPSADYADKRLREAEDYLKSVGYKYCIDWDENSGNGVQATFPKLEAKGVKQNAWYKVVGRKSDGTLLLGDDIRLYTLQKLNQPLYSGSQTVTASEKRKVSQMYNNQTYDYYYVVSEDRTFNISATGTITYYIVEINGNVFVQGISYSDVRYSNNRTSCSNLRAEWTESGGTGILTSTSIFK